MLNQKQCTHNEKPAYDSNNTDSIVEVAIVSYLLKLLWAHYFTEILKDKLVGNICVLYPIFLQEAHLNDLKVLLNTEKLLDAVKN